MPLSAWASWAPSLFGFAGFLKNLKSAAQTYGFVIFLWAPPLSNRTAHDPGLSPAKNISPRTLSQRRVSILRRLLFGESDSFRFGSRGEQFRLSPSLSWDLWPPLLSKSQEGFPIPPPRTRWVGSSSEQAAGQQANCMASSRKLSSPRARVPEGQELARRLTSDGSPSSPEISQWFLIGGVDFVS